MKHIVPFFFFFKQKTAYEIRISDWSSDVCSSDLCLPQRLGRDGRRAVRNRLISAMVDHALQSGVSVLTGVVTAVFRETILAMGWRAAPLGPARTHQGSSIGAFRLDIGADTPALLAANGIYTPGAITAVAAELA